MKKLVFLTFPILFQAHLMAQPKPKLMYFGDPMCSWCYGFSPAFSQVVESVKDEVEIQLIMGGLRPYNTETMADLGDFLKGHWEEVHQRSGQPFLYEILKDTSFVYDTEPACRAVVTMRQLRPELEFSFFKAVQHAFYRENKNTNLAPTYVELAEKFGLEGDGFRQKFESEEMKNAVRQDFTLAQKMGVNGFPTVVLMSDEKYYLLSNGYTKADHLIEQLEKLLKK